MDSFKSIQGQERKKRRLVLLEVSGYIWVVFQKLSKVLVAIFLGV